MFGKKKFTCRQLGGLCDQEISGSTMMELAQNGAKHMQSDEAHRNRMMSLAQSTGENREQWFARIKKEFDAK